MKRSPILVACTIGRLSSLGNRLERRFWGRDTVFCRLSPEVSGELDA